MSTSKTNQPGDLAAKHVAFTPAHPEAGDTSSASSQATSDNARSQQPQAAQGSASQQPAGTSTQSNDGREGGLEVKAKDWLNQQQWLQNIDVNQLSKQAKDLGSKAVEQVNRLTPTQKVVGGAILVSGLSWLALRSAGSSKGKSYRGGDSGSASHSDDDTWQRSSESVYRGHNKDA